MKTIEEKASLHAGKILEKMVDKYQNAPWNEFKDELAQIYLAGATEALKTQWQDPDTLTAFTGCKVLTRYRTKFQGTWLTITSLQDVEDWTELKNELHKADDLIAWMPLPELPKDKSK